MNEIQAEIDKDLVYDYENSELHKRLIKGKYCLRLNEKRMSESKEFYLMKLFDFVVNVKNYFKNCYYKDDDHICGIIRYLTIELEGLSNKIDSERTKAIIERFNKDKADRFESENIELINEGLK